MWLVVGYGSLLHSDDRVGHVVADRVLEHAGAGRVEIITATQLTPELAEPISRAAGVIFVDASTELSAGDVRYALLAPMNEADSVPAFTHFCTPASLMRSARELYGQAPSAWLCAVGAESFTLGESLSPAVSESVARVVTWIPEKLPA